MRMNGNAPLDNRDSEYVQPTAVAVYLQNSAALPYLSEVRSVVRVCVSVAGSGLLARNAFRTLSI
jgi:hypothetical protein